MPRQKPKKNAVIGTLERLDLSENEAVLYAAMLTHPRSSVRELEVRSPFPRTMLYYVLNQLAQKGLVSSVKEKGRAVYVAEDPERLYDLLAKKEQEFKREADAAQKLIPELKQKYRLSNERPNVRTFEGLEEYQKALEDFIISKPKESYAYESLVAKKPAREVRETHEGRRVKRKIQKNVLFFESKDALEVLKERGYSDYTQYRSILDDIDVFSVDVTLYSGKLLYTSYYDKHEPSAILIEDQALYEMQKSVFMSLWESGKDRTLYYTENV